MLRPPDSAWGGFIVITGGCLKWQRQAVKTPGVRPTPPDCRSLLEGGIRQAGTGSRPPHTNEETKMGMNGPIRLRWDAYRGYQRFMTRVDQKVAQGKADRANRGRVTVHVHNECSCCKNKTERNS